jgi:hypothetical protein
LLLAVAVSSIFFVNNEYISDALIVRAPQHRRVRAQFAQMSERDVLSRTRFLKADLARAMAAWNVPVRITLENGSFFEAEEFVLLLLCRFSRPFRLSDLENFFDCDYTLLSRGFNAMVDWFFDTHSFRLTNYQAFFASRYAYYNQKIVNKIQQQGINLPLYAEDMSTYTISIFHPYNIGLLVPAVATSTCSFVDAKLWETSRPGGNRLNQRVIYCGKSKRHGLKIQSLYFPDGTTKQLILL